MILYFLLGVIVLFVIAAAFGTMDANRKGRAAAERIVQMEQKYNDFVGKYIENHILQKDDFEVDFDQLVTDATQVIKPDLDGLLSLVNSTTYSIVSVKIEPQYFPNLVSLTDDFFRQSQSNKTKRLTEQNESDYYAAAKEAIEADIRKRLLDLQVGGF